MKKVLSILLVAAALFGFYGSAVNLNDILACKDYWEEAGEKSTADMNKLEDGLNQLKDNEQAYLDGVEQVADGEKALADGEAQYAEGLKSYEEAPAKLADARNQIAKGESDLADGKDSLDGLKKLIDGIKTIRKGYNKTWRPGYEALKDGRELLYVGTKDLKDSMSQLAAFLDEADRAAYLAAVEDVANDDGKQTADDYKEFIESTNQMAEDFPKIQEAVKTTYENAKALYGYVKGQSTNYDFAKAVNAKKAGLLSLAPLIEQANGSDAANTYKSTVEAVAGAYDSFDSTVDSMTDKTCAAKNDTNPNLTNLQAGTVQYLMQNYGMDAATAVAYMSNPDNSATVAQIQKGVKANIRSQVETAVKADYNSSDGTAGSQLTAAKVGLTQQYAKSGDGGVIGIVVSSLNAVNEQVNGDSGALNTLLLPGLKQFNAAATSDAVDQLADGQDTISGGIATVASAVLGNKTLKKGVKKNFGAKAIALLKAYRRASGPLSTSASDFAAFEEQMDSNPGVETFLKKAQKLLAKTRSDGLKTYNAGKKKLAAGKKQYAEGLQSYKEAPAKLADAEQQLADGRQALADGKAQLAQYEDGEQQVRDGLASLVGTEPDLGLESILDRLGGDGDFDNGDNHLDLDEGLAAVDVGRGYQADDGVLITEEIMARAVGTGALLGAGALALIAAILSFLKKNKGAGVFALLAAAAGAFGAFYGTNAGTYFSDIAGSTAGSAAWVAAGILGAVALVHAIVHFTAKKAA